MLISEFCFPSFPQWGAFLALSPTCRVPLALPGTVAQLLGVCGYWWRPGRGAAGEHQRKDITCRGENGMGWWCCSFGFGPDPAVGSLLWSGVKDRLSLWCPRREARVGEWGMGPLTFPCLSYPELLTHQTVRPAIIHLQTFAHITSLTWVPLPCWVSPVTLPVLSDFPSLNNNIFTEHLQSFRHCVKHWGYNRKWEPDKSPVLVELTVCSGGWSSESKQK